MKICFISSLYKPYIKGGSDIFVVELSEELVRQGHEVIIITTSPKFSIKNLTPNVEKINGVTIYRFFPLNIFPYYTIQKHNFFARLMYYCLDLYNFHSNSMVRKIIMQENPDVVHIHNIRGLSAGLPKIISKLKIKQAFTPHDVQLLDPKGYIIFGKLNNSNIFLKIHQKIMSIFFRDINLVISPSSFLKKLLVSNKYFKEINVKVLPNYVQTKKNVESKLLKKNSINFLYLGQLEEHKGVNLLLDVFSKKSLSNSELNIYGKGSLEKKVLEYSNKFDNINYHGFLERYQLQDAYQNNNVVIVPTLCYEHAQGIILESFSFGKPVVASNIGGIPEIIKDNYNGYLITPDNNNQLLVVLNNILNNPNKLLSEISKNSYKDSLNYNIENYVKKLISSYKDILSFS